jgi:hypothetical protein
MINFLEFTCSASNTGAFFRFRYFDIEKFQFRDSDINIEIERLKKRAQTLVVDRAEIKNYDGGLISFKVLIDRVPSALY